MVAENHIGSGMSSEKYYAAMYRNPAAENFAAKEAGNLRTGDTARETGLTWDRDSQGDAEIHADHHTDSLSLSTSTVSRNSVTAQPVVSLRGMQDKLHQFKDQLMSKLLQSYEEVFRNTYHWNLPLANMAKWSIDNIFNRLSIIGVESGKLEQIRRDVTGAMRDENRGNMRQVVETEAYQEAGIA